MEGKWIKTLYLFLCRVKLDLTQNKIKVNLEMFVVIQIINAGEAMEEVEKKIQEVALDEVKECTKGKPLSLLWSS